MPSNNTRVSFVIDKTALKNYQQYAKRIHDVTLSQWIRQLMRDDYRNYSPDGMPYPPEK